MKIASLSVLHQSVQAIPPPGIGAELLMFVAGNREFYGGDLIGTVRALHQHAEGSSVRLLEHDAWHRDGVRFLGCTLWSDYRLHESPLQRAQGHGTGAVSGLRPVFSD